MTWWRFVVASELRKIFAYRADFWFTFLGQTFVQLFIARALWENIFAATGSEVMEGYTLSMMTVYFLIVPIGNRILQGENMGFLSREIYDGSFNRYLIYPISFFQYKTLTYLTYSAFYGLQLFVIFFIYQFLFGTPEPMMVLNVLKGVLIFLLAAYTYMSLSMLIELLALWADNIWSLSVMCRFFTYFLGGSFIPIAFFPGWLQSALAYTPFPYLISLPIRTTMGISTWEEIGTGVVVLTVWSLILRMSASALWNKGQYKYSGVGI